MNSNENKYSDFISFSSNSKDTSFLNDFNEPANYKENGSIQSTQQFFFEDQQNNKNHPNHNNLVEIIKKLKSNRSFQYITQSLHFVTEHYRMKQDEELLDIFTEYNFFQMIINFVSSKNNAVSIEALKLIMDFTSLNEDFAQVFIEHNLFGILSNFVSNYQPLNNEKNQEMNNNQFFNIALSIIVNLSQFNQIYIKKLWKIFTPDLFFSIIDKGESDALLLKCAKIARCSILGSDISIICENSMKGLLSLLHHPNYKIVEISLDGILKYFDDNKKSIFQPKLFYRSQIQQTLEDFYLSDQVPEIVKRKSLLIIGNLLNNDVIDNYTSEALFTVLQDNKHSKLQESAFWCLYMAIYKDKIVDQPLLLGFLKDNIYEIMLQTSFKALYFGAHAIINLLDKLSFNDFVLNMNDVMMMTIIKLLQFEDQKIQENTLCLLLKFQLESDIISLFLELEGDEALKDIMKSDCDETLKCYVTMLSQRYDIDTFTYK